MGEYICDASCVCAENRGAKEPATVVGRCALAYVVPLTRIVQFSSVRPRQMSEAGPSDAAATLRCSNEACRATRSSCWYGKRPHKYCKRAACVALGKARGHIQTQHAGKRKRDDDAGAANGDERTGTVVRIDRILGCRRAATASPSRARAASSHIQARAATGSATRSSWTRSRCATASKRSSSSAACST